MATPKRLLIQHLYGDGLDADVARFVEEGKSWRAIAELIEERTGHPVSYESLRTWYGAEVKARAS